MRFSKNNNIGPSNKWATLLSEVLPKYKHTPIHFIDCYHKILQIPTCQLKYGNIIKSNLKHDEISLKNFEIIREKTSNSNELKKIIGIYLKSSTISKDIPFNTLIGLLKIIIENDRYFPVLLISPIKDEKEYANTINEHFNNSLVTVEADFIAMTSIMKNIDILLTPDTVAKHIADLMGTLTLEISLGYASFLKQGTYNEKSFILTRELKQRFLSTKERSTIKNDIAENDIYKCIDFILSKENEKKIRPLLSPHKSLYKASKDNLGIKYEIILGDYNGPIEISLAMSRYFISKFFNEKGPTNLPDISKYSSKEIDQWIYEQKKYSTYTTRDLLNTLRSLLSIQDNIKKVKNFIQALDKLLEHCNSDNLIAIPTIFFRAEIEAISDKSMVNNIKRIEQLLYKLKSDYKIVVGCIRDFEKEYFESTIKKSKKNLINSKRPRPGRSSEQFQI